MAKKCNFPQFSVAKKFEIFPLVLFGGRFGVGLVSVWGRFWVSYQGSLGAALGGTQDVSQVGSEGVFGLALS